MRGTNWSEPAGLYERFIVNQLQHATTLVRCFQAVLWIWCTDRSLCRLLWEDTFCCRERYIAQMTCNINKVVTCFLCCFLFSTELRCWSCRNIQVRDVLRQEVSSRAVRCRLYGLEKLHKAITSPVCSQTFQIWSMNLHRVFSVCVYRSGFFTSGKTSLKLNSSIMFFSSSKCV